MLTCTCCGTWRLEWAVLDRIDGRGPRLMWRILNVRADGLWVRWAEYDDMDAAVAELVRRGIRIFE